MCVLVYEISLEGFSNVFMLAGEDLEVNTHSFSMSLKENQEKEPSSRIKNIIENFSELRG